jgi:hypothetical protein
VCGPSHCGESSARLPRIGEPYKSGGYEKGLHTVKTLGGRQQKGRPRSRLDFYHLPTTCRGRGRCGLMVRVLAPSMMGSRAVIDAGAGCCRAERRRVCGYGGSRWRARRDPGRLGRIRSTAHGSSPHAGMNRWFAEFRPGPDSKLNNCITRDNRAYRYPVGMTAWVAFCQACRSHDGI